MLEQVAARVRLRRRFGKARGWSPSRRSAAHEGIDDGDGHRLVLRGRVKQPLRRKLFMSQRIQHVMQAHSSRKQVGEGVQRRRRRHSVPSSTAAATSTSATATARAATATASASTSRPRDPVSTRESAAPPSATASTRCRDRRWEQPTPAAGCSSKVNPRRAWSPPAATRGEVAEHYLRGLSGAAPTGNGAAQDRRISVEASRRQRPAGALASAPSGARLSVVPGCYTGDLARRTISGNNLLRDGSVGLTYSRTSAPLNQV